MAVVNITSDTIKTVAFSIGGMRGCTASAVIGNHHLFNAANCRVREDWDSLEPNKQGAKAESASYSVRDTNGPLYYLPYQDENIYSMVLPGNPPAGCRKFLTANMSGCRFFVDDVVGSNDIIVYHANTKQHGAVIGGTANSQSPQASAILDGLHTTARNDYLAAPRNLTTAPRGQLVKYDYLKPGEAAAMRKRKQGRTDTAPVPTPRLNDPTKLDDVYTPGQAPIFLGGTTIFGEFNGRWNFFYQTWGFVSYDRQVGVAAVAKSLVTFQWTRVHKIRTQKEVVDKSTRVLDSRQFI